MVVITVANTIKVSVLGDVRDINSKLGTVNKQLSEFGKTTQKVSSLAKGLFAGFVATKAVGELKSAIDAGSDLNETVSKTKTIFGDASPGILKFGKSAATSLGLSQQAALDGVSTFGNFFNQIGVGAKQSSELSKSFVRMSSDLASFNNAAPEDVMDALASATRGEYDSLQKFIPTINAAKVQTEALAATGKESADALTDQDKAIALHTLAVKGMGKAEGDFARTSGGLANQQRILKAQLDNVRASIGSALLPVMTKVVTFINNTLVPAFREHGPNAVAAIKDAFESIKAAVGPVVEAFGTLLSKLTPEDLKAIGIAFGVLAAAIVTVSAVTAVWNAILAVNPITLVVVAIAALVAALILAYNHSERFRAVVDAVFGFLKKTVPPIIGFVVGFIRDHWKLIVGIIGGPIAIAVMLVVKHWNTIKSATQKVWNFVKSIVTTYLGAVKAVISTYFNLYKTVISTAWNAIKAVFTNAWKTYKTIVTTAIGAIVKAVSGIKSKLTGALAGIGTWLLQAGKDLIQGMINGVKQMAGALVDSAKGVVGGAIKGAKSLLGINSPSRVFKEIGQWTIKGLIKGLRDGRSGVRDVMSDVTDAMEKVFDKRFKDNDKRAKKALKNAVKALGDETKALIKNAKKREVVYRKLEKAQKRLADLQKSFKDYKNSVVNNALGYTDITGMDSAFNSDALIASLGSRLEKVKQFAALIKDLVKKGLNQTQIQQLVNAGVEGGLGYAQAIADGGPEAIAELNDLQNQINQAADGLGTTAAQDMYGAGIQAAEGLIKGLQAQRKKLEKFARQLAKDLVNAIKKELQIKSPSRVFKAIGKYTIDGLVIGLEDTRKVKAAMSNVSKAVVNGYSPTPATAMAGSAGTGANNYYVTVNTLKADAEVGRVVVDSIKQYERIGGRK